MWYNSFVIPILRSPLHAILGPNTILVTYKGRKSGKTFRVPVNILASLSNSPDQFLVSSLRERTWWRNLRDGNPFSVRQKGQEYQAAAEVVDDVDELQQVFEAVFRQAPGIARYYGVRILDGAPEPGDIQRISSERIIIRISLMGF